LCQQLNLNTVRSYSLFFFLLPVKHHCNTYNFHRKFETMKRPEGTSPSWPSIIFGICPAEKQRLPIFTYIWFESLPFLQQAQQPGPATGPGCLV
ncbi:MAG: hypothetical protein LUC47_01395, partial [Clostridiales bacterium]|nr:hypothetical protein [Clostridiales bacterium]